MEGEVEVGGQEYKIGNPVMIGWNSRDILEECPGQSRIISSTTLEEVFDFCLYMSGRCHADLGVL